MDQPSPYPHGISHLCSHVEPIWTSPVNTHRNIYDYPERPTSKIMFTVFDEDKNGNIDACEWMEAGMTSNVREFVRILDEIDKNKDDVLSMEEFEELHVRWKYRVLAGGTSAEEEN
ncbi:hypothetical protein HOLleu_39959 [Holothuria leucospilota]|uniref:EF-hand domain-containing protein n=1 Tax=Holothuria leucospilota TaxID=206669 RepID=A0A9Q0YCZ7_HOLLE|nr:hypothetical protein HOLleu_39959 [Holothuria leucospilota]